VESDRYLVVKRDSRNIHMIRLVRQSHLRVDEGEARNKGLYRLDKGCRREFGIFGIHVEGDEVDYIRVGHDRRHRLLMPRRAVCQYNNLGHPNKTHLLRYMA